jgi:hypothetical protein
MNCRYLFPAMLIALAALRCVGNAETRAGLTVKRAGTTIFTDSAALEKNMRRLIRNDTAILQLDSAYLIGSKAVGIVGEYKKKRDSLESLQSALENLNAAQASKYDSLIGKWKQNDSIQNLSYDRLNKLFTRSDSLLTRSIKNTDAAISVAKAIRRQSYLTSAIMGAVTGLVISSSADGGLTGGIGGGVGGAVAGMLLNGLMLKFVF